MQCVCVCSLLRVTISLMMEVGVNAQEPVMTQEGTPKRKTSKSVCVSLSLSYKPLLPISISGVTLYFLVRSME